MTHKTDAWSYFILIVLLWAMLIISTGIISYPVAPKETGITNMLMASLIFYWLPAIAIAKPLHYFGEWLISRKTNISKEAFRQGYGPWQNNETRMGLLGIETYKNGAWVFINGVPVESLRDVHD